jgi:hypothetical protein
MNPLAVDLILSVLRWALASVGGWLVAHGIWTQAQAESFAIAASLGLLSLGLSLWQTYSKRRKLVTALSLPLGCTERDVEYAIDRGRATPSVTTAKDVSPRNRRGTWLGSGG